MAGWRCARSPGSKIQCAGDFTGGKSISGETGNVLAVLKGNPEFPSVQLSVHLDRTERQIAPVPVAREGNILKVAPGNDTILGGDDAAGIALIFAVVDYLKAHDIPHGDIYVSGLVSEETGGDGAKYLPRDGMQGDLALVLDGYRSNEVIYGGSDIYSWNMKIKGAGDHVSLAPNCIDAGETAALIRTKGWGIHDGKYHGNPKSVVVATSTRCGTAYTKKTETGEAEDVEAGNKVPDICLINGQVRTGVVGSQKNVIERMENEVQKICKKSGATCEFSATLRLAGFQDPTTPILKVAQAGYRRAGLKRPELNLSHGGSNANFLFPERGNIVLWGIGASKLHTKHETLDLDDTINSLKTLIGVFKELSIYRRVRVGAP